MKVPLDKLIRVQVEHQGFLGHVDGSGRGLDDGECIFCGDSGSLEGWECPERLRQRLDEVEAVVKRLGFQIGHRPSAIDRRQEGSRADLTLRAGELKIDGKPVVVYPLGRGAFTRAFRAGDTAYVVVRPESEDKDVLAAAHSAHPKNPHLPKITFLGELSDDRKVYRMPVYQPLRAAHKTAWTQFLALKEAVETHRKTEDFYARINRYGGYAGMERIVEIAAKDKDIPKSLRTALLAILYELSDRRPTFNFEFAVRNLAVDEKGRLVLLDPFYDALLLDELRETRRKKRGLRW